MGFQVGANGIDFRSAANLAVERVRTQVENKIRTYATTLLTELQHDTPILTGQARASWLVALGSPSGVMYGPAGLTTSIRELAHGPPARIDWGQSQSINLSLIAQWKLGAPLYIYNNLPYIERLNEGYSGQAPAGFVEAAVMRASAAIKG